VHGCWFCSEVRRVLLLNRRCILQHCMHCNLVFSCHMATSPRRGQLSLVVLPNAAKRIEMGREAFLISMHGPVVLQKAQWLR
jgi:hypothetical protein